MKRVSEPTNVELLCIPCMHTAVHTLTYVDRHLVALECQECHHRVEMREVGSDDVIPHQISLNDMERLYTEEFLRRILTKPQRITQEWKDDLSLLLVTLPLRLITKPYRLLREILRSEDHSDSQQTSDR